MLWTQAVVPGNPRAGSQANMKKIQNYVFNLNELLGAGNFSRVYKAVNQVSNQVSAIKVVELSSMKSPTLIQLLYSEIEILKTLKHPNILNCLEVFSSNNNCYIITEFCAEGDLETRIRDWGAMSEMQARKLIYEVFAGLKYLSDNQIIHRDLKVANVFLNNGIAKIADFGFAKKLKSPTQRFKDINIGSPIYMSPEGLLNNYYGPKTDVWAFGVFMYEILHGDTPLAFCQSEIELYTNLKIPLTKDKIHPSLSNELKDLILKCLEVDETKRITFQEMYNHPYIIYLRKLYEKPEQLLVPQIATTQPKLKTSESTNMSHQSKSQADTEAMINQYNSMSLQQRATSFMSIGNQSQSPYIQSISNTQIPMSPQMNQSTPYIMPLPSPSTTQLIANQPSSNHFGEITPSTIIANPITFPQCVQLLHYCRLVYKCFNFGKQSKSCAKLNPYLSNWVLSLMTEVQNKETTHVTFVGDRAALRQEKLHEVIAEYNSKYKNELKWVSGHNVDLALLQRLISETLVSLDTEIKMSRSPIELEHNVKLSHYLYSLQEVNVVLKKAVDIKDMTPLVSAKIEDFLNRKAETFTLESYGSFRNKICPS